MFFFLHSILTRIGNRDDDAYWKVEIMLRAKVLKNGAAEIPIKNTLQFIKNIFLMLQSQPKGNHQYKCK